MPRKVNKHDRAGRKGKLIECPYCHTIHRVSHFAWAGILCGNPSCAHYHGKAKTGEDASRLMIDKYDWIIAANQDQKAINDLDGSWVDNVPEIAGLYIKDSTD